MYAWDVGFRSLILEIDSQTVTRMITLQHSFAPHVETLIDMQLGRLGPEIGDWRSCITIEKEILVQIAWLYRHRPLGSHRFTRPPIDIRVLPQGDLVGISVPIFAFLNSSAVFLSWALATYFSPKNKRAKHLYVHNQCPTSSPLSLSLSRSVYEFCVKGIKPKTSTKGTAKHPQE